MFKFGYTLLEKFCNFRSDIHAYGSFFTYRQDLSFNIPTLSAGHGFICAGGCLCYKS